MKRLTLILLLLAAGLARAAEPPQTVHFQAVLRDASGVPIDGEVPLQLWYFESEAGGTDLRGEIPPGPIVAVDGLVSVQLGAAGQTQIGGLGFRQMLQSYSQVWVELRIDGETLSPRFPIDAAPYAINARTLQGRQPAEFIDASAAAQAMAGSLTVNGLDNNEPALRLNADGPDGDSFLYFYENGSPSGKHLKWDDAESDFELNGDLQLRGGYLRVGGGPPRTFSQFGGTSAEPPSGQIAGNADLFVAEDLEVGSRLFLNRFLYLNGGGPDANQFINFYEDGFFAGEQLIWSNDADRFELSDDVFAQGSLSAGDQLYVASTAGDPSLYFDAGGGPAEASVAFDGGLFALSHPLDVGGALRFDGTSEQLAWNAASSRFDLSDGLRLAGTFELEGSAVRLNVDGPDGDQTIYFYDGGQALNEALRWDDSADEFLFTNDLFVNGQLEVAATTIRFNIDGPDQDQALYFYDNAASSNEQLRWDDSADEFIISDDLIVQGNLSATGAKPFVQNHPEDASLSVVYVALEGDEAGVYTRGSAVVENGFVRVPLGESFRLVANPEIGLTAHLTPHARGVLWIDSVSATELVVRSESREPIAFDYLVHGLRIGHEQFATIAPRRVDARVPGAAERDAPFAGRPELRAQTALERFRKMPRHAEGEGSAAQAIVAAIGVRAGEDEPTVVEAIADAAPVVEVEPRPRPTRQAAAPATAEAAPLRPSMAILLDGAEALAPGTVVAFDPAGSGQILAADGSAGGRVAGVVVPREHAVLQAGSDDGVTVAVAFAGVVEVAADASFGAILPGDLLVASPHAGRAMRDLDPEPGAVIGKAVTALESGEGRVRILLSGR